MAVDLSAYKITVGDLDYPTKQDALIDAIEAALNSAGALSAGAHETITGKWTFENEVDLKWGGLTLLMGADGDATSRTDATAKAARIGGAHYTNAEEPMALLVGFAQSAANVVNIGGGTASFNAATDIVFWTASDITTTTGIEVLRIDDTNADFSGIDVQIDNTKAFSSKDAGGTQRTILTMNNSDELFVGNLSHVDNLRFQSSTGVYNFNGPSGANTIVEIQAANNKQSELLMAGVDIAHGITTQTQTDVYFRMLPFSATNGGVVLKGVSGADSIGMLLQGFIGSTSPTEVALQLRAGKYDGATNVEDLAATETAFQFAGVGGSPAYLTIYGSGAQAIVSTATGQNVLDITADSVTTNFGIAMSADALTTGSLFNFESNSADTTARTLGTIINNHVDAVNVSILTLKNDGAGDADAGKYLDFNNAPAANTNGAVTSFTTGATVQGSVKIEVGGVTRFIEFTDAPTS